MSDNVISNEDVPMTGVSVKQPMFNGVTVLCTVGDVVTVKGDDNIRQLRVPLVFDEPATTVDGREVTPGFKHTDRIDIDPRGKRTQRQCQEDIGRLQVGVLGLPDVRDPFRASELVGQKVKVLFTVRQFTKNDGTPGEAQQCKYLKAK